MRSSRTAVLSIHEQVEETGWFILIVYFLLGRKVDVTGQALEKGLPLISVRNGFPLIQKLKTANL